MNINLADVRSIQGPSREVFCFLNHHCPRRLGGRVAAYYGWMLPIRIEDLVSRGLLFEAVGNNLPVPTPEGLKYFCRQCGRRRVFLPACSQAYHSRNLAIIPSRHDLLGRGFRTDVNFSHVPRGQV